MTTTLRVLFDKVLIKPDEADTKSKGGILLPDVAQEKPVWGTVVDVGEGRILQDGTVFPLRIRKGDRVYYSKYAGYDLEVDGVQYKAMREDDVLAIEVKR